MRLKSRKRENKQAKGSNNVENFALSHQKCVHELKSTSLLKFSLHKVEKGNKCGFIEWERVHVLYFYLKVYKYIHFG